MREYVYAYAAVAPQLGRMTALSHILLWDCEYGCAPFVLKTADSPADKLIRLRSNMSLWTAPPPHSGSCRPRKHGQKFKLNDSSTWGEADEHLEVDDSKLGLLKALKPSLFT